MTFSVEYNGERGSAQGNGGGAEAMAAQRATESFATEAEAIDFISHLPPLRDPVLVMEDGERIRGSALCLHVVGWQANDAHRKLSA
jgi:hypothetical protein